MASSISELCEPFKALAPDGTPTDPMSMALAVDDDVAIKMLAAFPRIVLPRWKAPGRSVPADLSERWLWLWAGYLGGPDVPVFLDDLALRAGVSPRLAAVRWPALVTSRLLFPDGTLHEDAKVLVRAFVADNLPKPPPSPKKRWWDG